MEFVVPSDFHPPKLLVEFGNAIGACKNFVELVHFARERHDPQMRPDTVAFQKGKNERLVADVFLRRKKYTLNITPKKGIDGVACGNEVLRMIKTDYPQFKIEGEELFRKKDAEAATHVLPSSSDETVPVIYITDESKPLPQGEKTTPEDMAPLIVPIEIWSNLRALAIYHFIYHRLWYEHDPDFMLADDTHGRVRMLVKKIEEAFSASGGTVNDPLQILRDHKVIETERGTSEDTLRKWSIFRFVENVPEIKESPQSLWSSRSRRKADILPASIPCAETTKKNEAVPTATTIWHPNRDARAMAAYYFLTDLFLNSNDPDCELIDEGHGRVTALYAKLEKVFDTNPGAVDRVIKVLQTRGIIQREHITRKHEKVTWIFNFISDVPALPEGETVQHMWHSRDNMRGRQFLSLEASTPEQEKEEEMARSPSLPETSLVIPGNFEEQVRLFGELRKKLRRNGFVMIVEACREAHERITRIIADTRGTFTEEELQIVETMLTQLHEFYESLIVKT